MSPALLILLQKFILKGVCTLSSIRITQSSSSVEMLALSSVSDSVGRAFRL